MLGDVSLTVSHLDNCHITTFESVINVECDLVDSTAIAFQVIAQLGVSDRVYRLHVNQTLPGQTSASVEVEEDGEYLVSIFPILEQRGITNSSVEYREVVMVMKEGSFTPGK